MNPTHEVTCPEHGDLYLEERPGDDPAIVYTALRTCGGCERLARVS